VAADIGGEGASMQSPKSTWLMGTLALCAAMALSAGSASELNPAALRYTLPNQIHWVDNGGGAMQAVMVGNPERSGLYVVLVKWTAHHMSHPHFHPNDRYITVLSGTWWVGTGRKFDPDRTVPLPAGSFVIHYGRQVHYDGAKDGDAVLEIVGEGPATVTPAEDAAR
jgi:quercetin dioxygenase-like cupin family protein